MQEVPHEYDTMTPTAYGGRIRDDRSMGELFRELAEESRTLLQQEVQLAKAEMSQKVDRVTTQATSIGIGGAVAYAGVLTLCGAAAAGLFVFFTAVLDMAPTISLWLAPLIVGGILAGVGYALINRGIVNLKQTRLTPRMTADSLRETKEWMQEKMK